MEVDYQIIKRYLDGKGTNKDKMEIIRWFNKIEVEKSLQENSRFYWNELSEYPGNGDYDENVILGRIYYEVKRLEDLKKPKRGKSVRFLNTLGKIAAVLFLPLLFLYLSEGRLNFSGNEVSYAEIYSPIGSRTQFYLPDGSKGWLNGGSHLKYPEHFTGKTRNVKLRGEAFFDVKTNPKKPFIVSGKHLIIIAKGTSFNVSAMDDTPEVEVVLVNGLVDVYTQNDEQKLLASLTPGKLLYSTPTSNNTKNVDVEKYISWTKGKLVFRDDSFKDVVKKINQWYNVNLIIRDEFLESYKYVATFQDESLDEVLRMLIISAPIRIKENKKVQAKDGTFGKRTIELYYKP